MTNEQKQKIAELRNSGISYQKIGDMLGIPKDTVKTFCRRNNIVSGCSDKAIPKETAGICPECGKPIVQTPGRKPKRFCSSECRQKWWNAHPDRIGRKAIYTYVCPVCNTPFFAYGNNHRKYCSHECYVVARFKGGERRD